jgi:hypothetical protein
MYKLMLISDPLAAEKAARSLSAVAPEGIVIEALPPKVTARIEPDFTLAAPFGSPTVREPTTSGEEPNSFERRMQI